MFFSTLQRFSDWSLLALRLSIAAIFLYHGLQKSSFFTSFPDRPLMMVLAVAEPLAGLGVLLGLFTRLAAALLAVVMIGATYFKIAVFQTGFAGTQGAGWEFDIMILAGCLALLTLGAGKISVDAATGRS